MPKLAQRSTELFINGRFLAQRLSGVQRYAEEIVLAIDRLLVDGELSLRCTLVAPRSDLRPIRLGAIRLRRWGVLRGHLWEQVELPQIVRGGWLLSLANTGPLAKMDQTVVLYDAGVFDRPDLSPASFAMYYRALLPLLSQRARKIATISEFSQRRLHRWLGVTAPIVYPSGDHIGRVRANTEVLDRFRLRAGAFVLVVGRGKRKNLPLVFRAAEALRESGIVLVLVGSEGESANRNVVEVGSLPDADLRALYESALCLVFPSVYEGFGIPPLEAMTCSCPVIAGSLQVLRETCGDAALYCSVDDPEDLAGQIRKLYRDQSLRSALIRAGLLRVQDFDWERSARALVGMTMPLTSSVRFN